MATERFGLPYVWVTWMTPYLAGERSCYWAPWFRSRYQAAKVENQSGDLNVWKSNHAEMVELRAKAVTAATGAFVKLEDQNAWKVKGNTAQLSGKPDIQYTLQVQGQPPLHVVEDCKTGKRKSEHWWQVATYMWALKKRGEWPVQGHVVYTDGIVRITPEELTPEVERKIPGFLKRIGSDEVPARVPSPRECGLCDVTPADCPDRQVADVQQVTTEDF